MNRRELGMWGEDAALRYLEGKGYSLLTRNYRGERCEIDLIMEHKGALIFVDVKTRRSDAFGLGREAVTRQKQLNLIKAAQSYLNDGGLNAYPARFDVVEVNVGRGGIQHVINAFTA